MSDSPSAFGFIGRWLARAHQELSALDIEAEQNRESQNAARDRFTVFYIILVAAFSLTVSDLSYLGGEEAAIALFRFIDDPSSPSRHPFYWALIGWLKPDDGLIQYSRFIELYHLIHWAGVKVLAYLVIPAIAVALHPDLRFSTMGLTTRGLSRHIWLYVALFLPVLLLVIGVSFTEEFSTYYPFYRFSTRSAFDFWIWEAVYILQFFALEFFFRGFLLQPLRRIMGSSAVWAAVLPYVMIHFGKPFPECMAAVFAGAVLGYLALSTRSIWAGFLIHASVALSMDVAANLQTAGFGWLKTIF